jgi:hypothetical protein
VVLHVRTVDRQIIVPRTFIKKNLNEDNRFIVRDRNSEKGRLSSQTPAALEILAENLLNIEPLPVLVNQNQLQLANIPA